MTLVVDTSALIAIANAEPEGPAFLDAIAASECFAYALARTRNLPLLFKGEDFLHTDIRSALSPA